MINEINTFLDSVFTEDLEFGIFNDSTKTFVDEKEFSKTGTITKNVKEEDGLVTETFEYESFDGKTKFSKTQSYYKHQEFDFKLKCIDEQLHQAVLIEDFIKANELKLERENLLQSNNL